MTISDQELEAYEGYTRRSRQASKRRRMQVEAPSFNEHFKDKILPLTIWQSLLWSLLLSLISVANPFLTEMANSIQSQNLYAGFAMQAGRSPYGDFFGSSGVLFYLLTQLGSSFGTTIGLAILQFIALFVAGIFFDKIVGYYSQSHPITNQLTVWFYLFILALDFGGLYASLLALPFILTSLWFLVRYFDNAVRDEGFIFYGMDAAIVFMIDPKSVLLWAVATLILLGYNIKYKRKARGFYQLLAGLFGFLLVIYSVGYYTFIKQILGVAISQTFLYNLDLNFQLDHLTTPALIIGAVLVISGFLITFFKTLGSLRDERRRYMKVVALLTFLAQLIFILGNQSFDLHQLIAILPYGFLMVALQLPKEIDAHADYEEYEEESQASFSYLKASLFLPLLACMYIPLQPVIFYLLEGQVAQERTSIAHYIKEHAEADASIYAWDDNAQVYLESQHLSAGTFITVKPHLDKTTNQQVITYDLNKNKAQYVVVNKDIPLLKNVKSNLEKNYNIVDTDTSYLTLYQKNN
ncbi:quinol oxidase [Streptococcus sp. X16XC17]|uniref:hypothetical protein n=1 Tax=unclassified Streptococcus TaxID=2608887 RepID=UPI00066FF08C|nr:MULTISPECIES: hypothetical protein [unclassified Streptococcus]TCD45870.1 quinol oxidase [Streptococcus sp. X16XC17]